MSDRRSSGFSSDNERRESLGVGRHGRVRIYYDNHDNYDDDDDHENENDDDDHENDDDDHYVDDDDLLLSLFLFSMMVTTMKRGWL